MLTKNWEEILTLVLYQQNLQQLQKHCLRMDPSDSLQDVMCCDNCEAPNLQKNCKFCQRHLCEDCVVKHLSDKSKRALNCAI